MTKCYGLILPSPGLGVNNRGRVAMSTNRPITLNGNDWRLLTYLREHLWCRWPADLLHDEGADLVNLPREATR